MEIYYCLLVVLTSVLLLQGDDKELNLNVYCTFFQNDYQLKFEWLELVRYNKDFMENFSIVTFKYNQIITVANASFIIKVDFGNDAVGIIQAYKFMSNEYRHFPIRFAANCCKGLAANVAGLTRITKCGNFKGCPVLKGRYHVCNWYPDPSKYPPYIPNGQYKLEIQILLHSKEMFVTNAYGTVSRPIV